MDKEKHLEQKCLAYLSENPIKFDPVSEINNAFFDPSNKQVITVRSGGVTGVQVQGPTEELCLSFRMPDKGPVIYIKLSPKQNILTLQRRKSQLEFMNLKGNEIIGVEYTYKSKLSANIYGFIWSQPDEIIITTDQGIELLQVFPEKCSVKSLKSFSMSINWFATCPVCNLILLGLGPKGKNLLPISYPQPGVLNKLQKFQVDVPEIPAEGVTQESGYTLAKLYGNACFLVLHYPTHSSVQSHSGTQILIYTVHKTLQTTRKTHVLHLECCGYFALNTVDNLILVHHQESSSTMLFDIGMESESSDVVHLKRLGKPSSIKPCTIRFPGQEPVHCQLYSANWAIFQPNIIIDVVLGFLWFIEVDLSALLEMQIPPDKLVYSLLRRKHEKALPLLYKVLEDITDPCKGNNHDLKMISKVFNVINASYRKQLNLLAQPHVALPAGHLSSEQTPVKHLSPETVVIDQVQMYSNIFSKFSEKKSSPNYDGEFGIKVILEYMRSLNDFHIPVQELNDLLITCLLEEKNGLPKLHYLLQYRVLPDSKPLACTLLSLENVYPAALQLSLDMLKRLGNADDEIMEIMLHKQLILPTIRFARSAGLVDQLSARKFLEAAQATNNPVLFYSVYKFFEKRNQRLKGTLNFSDSALCQSFVEHMKSLFPDEYRWLMKTTVTKFVYESINWMERNDEEPAKIRNGGKEYFSVNGSAVSSDSSIRR